MDEAIDLFLAKYTLDLVDFSNVTQLRQGHLQALGRKVLLSSYFFRRVSDFKNPLEPVDYKLNPDFLWISWQGLITDTLSNVNM